MAELRFDVTGNTSGAQKATRDLASTTDLAARGARLLADSLDKQRRAAATSVGATLTLAKADKILADAEHALTDGALEAEFALKRETQAAQKSGDAAARAAVENRTLASSLRKISESSAFKPSGLGAALALSPSLIPLAGVAAGAVGALGISFGAAALAAGAFGVVAKGNLTELQKQLTKVQAANKAAAVAEQTAASKRTASQKQAIANAKTLTAAFQKEFGAEATAIEKLKGAWLKFVTQPAVTNSIAVFATVATLALRNLTPVIKPVADVFRFWGITLNTYFSDPAHAQRIRELAAAFGNFAAQQLYRIGQFVVDIGKGIFNLGRDLAASGANFNAFGPWLSHIGDAFLSWSKSASARRDVQGFMKFIHDEGPVVKGILKDLGTLLPGIFAGATTVGTLELKALGDFLSLVANLPPGWQKPLTEFAGAMLLLSKIGVVKVGLKFTGLGLGALGAAGGSAPLAGAGAAIAAGLVLKIREDLKAGIVGIGKDLPGWFSGIGGIVGLSAQGWADAIVNRFQKPVIAAQKTFGRALIASFKADWGAITASFHAFTGALLASMKAFGSALLASAKASWGAITASARAFATAVVGVFRGLTGRALAAMFGLGHALAAFASSAFHEMWNAIKNVAGSIWNWLTSWVNRLPGWLRHLLGIRSPSSVFYDIGKQMMLGLFHGIRDHAHHAANAARSATSGFRDTGARSGSAAIAQAYARSILPRGWSWPDLLALWNQESGWSAYAVNKSSGAYGIPQSLGHGHPYNLGDYKAQIQWGINYIANRPGYGNSQNAWAHEQAYGWYGSGLHGWVNSPTLIGVGERGRERVDITPAGRRGADSDRVVLEIRSGGTRLDDAIVEIIRQAVKVRGGGNVQVALGRRGA